MIADLHCDTIFKTLAGADFGEKSPNLEINLPALNAGGVKLQLFASFVSSAKPIGKARAEAMRLLDGTDELVSDYESHLLPVNEFEDLQQLETDDRVGVMKAVENGQAIENELSNLAEFRKRGVRYLTLTHSKNLKWAASSAEKRADFDGLTRFGESVIAAMNDLGIIVDVSHVHERTFWKVAGLSKKPFIASHSNAYSICPTARNLKDDQIKAIADSGGMIGINFFPGFLDALYEKEMTANTVDLFYTLQKLEMDYIDDPQGLHNAMQHWTDDFRKKMKLNTVGLDRVIDHIEYVTRLVGSDFVGFGSDFDGIPALPEDLSSAADMTALIKRMRERNFSEKNIKDICWNNFKRVVQLNS